MSMFLGNLFELLNSKLKLDSGLESFASNLKDAFTDLFTKDVQEELDFNDAPKADKGKVEIVEDGQTNEGELLSERSHTVVRVAHTEATAFEGLKHNLASDVADIFKGTKPLAKPQADTFSPILVEDTAQVKTPAPAAPAPAPLAGPVAAVVPAAAAAILPGGLGLGGGLGVGGDADSSSTDSDSSYSTDTSSSTDSDLSYSTDSDLSYSTDSDLSYSTDSDTSSSVDSEDDTNGFNILNLLNRFNPFNFGQNDDSQDTDTSDHRPLSDDDHEQTQSEANSSSSDTSSNSTDASFKSAEADVESFETSASSTESDHSSVDLDNFDPDMMPTLQGEPKDNAGPSDSDKSSFGLDILLDDPSLMPKEQEEQKDESKDNPGSAESGLSDWVKLPGAMYKYAKVKFNAQDSNKDEHKDNAGSSESDQSSFGLDTLLDDPSLMPKEQEEQKDEPKDHTEGSSSSDSSLNLEDLDATALPQEAVAKPVSLFDYVQLPTFKAPAAFTTVKNWLGFGAQPTEEQPQRAAEEKQRLEEQRLEEQRLEREAEEKQRQLEEQRLEEQRLEREAEEKQRQLEEQQRLEREAEEKQRQLEEQQRLESEAEEKQRQLEEQQRLEREAEEQRREEALEHERQEQIAMQEFQEFLAQKSKPSIDLADISGKEMPTLVEGSSGSKDQSASTEAPSKQADLGSSSEQSHSGNSADTNPLLTMELPEGSEVFDPLAGIKAEDLPTDLDPLAQFSANDLPIGKSEAQDPLLGLELPKDKSSSPAVSESSDSINLSSIIELPVEDSQDMPSFEEAVLQKTIEFLGKELVGEKMVVEGQLLELQSLLGKASTMLEPSVFAKCQETLQELQGFMQSSESSDSIDPKCLQEAVCHLVSEISASIMSIRHLADTPSGQTKFAEGSVEDVTVPLGKTVEKLGQGLLQLVVDKVSLKLLQDSTSIEPKASTTLQALEPSDIVSADKTNPLDYQGQQLAAKYHGVLSGLATLNTQVTKAEISKAYQCEEVFGKATAKLEQLLIIAHRLSVKSDSESSKAPTQPANDIDWSAWIKLPGTMYKYAKVKFLGPDSITDKPAESADKSEHTSPLSELSSSLLDDSIDPVKFKLASLTHEAESHSTSSAWKKVAQQVKAVETAYDKLVELETAANEAHEQFEHYKEETFLPTKQVYTEYLQTHANLAHASDKVDVAEDHPQPVKDNSGGGWWNLFGGGSKASSSETTEKGSTDQSATHGNEEHTEGNESFSLSDMSASALLPQDTHVEPASNPFDALGSAFEMPTGEEFQ